MVKHLHFVTLHFSELYIFKKTDDVDEHALFDYGPPAGDPLVRRQLAEFLKDQYNDNVDRSVELNVRYNV